MTSFADVVATAQDLVTTSAVVIGGGWAYLKFVRGRVYAPRVELCVSADLFKGERTSLLIGQVSLENRGLTRLRLQPDRQVVYLHVARLRSADHIAEPRLEKIAITPVFQPHLSVEAQERIADDVRFQLPLDGADDTPVLYRIEAEVWAAKGWLRRTGRRWMASSTVLGEGWSAGTTPTS